MSDPDDDDDIDNPWQPTSESEWEDPLAPDDNDLDGIADEDESDVSDGD